jgi:hypothetical protein
MLGINEGTSNHAIVTCSKMLQGQINKLKITVMEPNKLENSSRAIKFSGNSAFRRLAVNWMQCLRLLTRVIATGETNKS